MKKATVVIPAFNEEKTIYSSVIAAKKSKYVDEVIVVDDGSKDKTYALAKKAGAAVLRHAKNKGKGAAIKKGIKKAKNEIICFVDADLKNISSQKISKLIKPVVEGKADFVKSSFKRKGGRVTELVAKPLLRLFYPAHSFSQPLSGQFCAKKSFLQSINIPDKWGVDLGVFLDALEKKQRVIETDLGTINHKHQPLSGLTVMAEDVIQTIFGKAGVVDKYAFYDKANIISGLDSEIKSVRKAERKYELIVFDLDKTLIDASSIEIIAKKMGFSKQLKLLRNELNKGNIAEYQVTEDLAKLLKGKKPNELKQICAKISLKKNAAALISSLNKKDYGTAIISSAFHPITRFFADKLGIKKTICPVLKMNRGVFTGETVFSKTADYNRDCCGQSVCKKKVIQILATHKGISTANCVAVGDGVNDLCMLDEAGLGIALAGNKKAENAASIVIDNLAEVLLYV